LNESGVDLDITQTIKELEEEMVTAANNLEFEKAALLRDQVRELKRSLDGSEPLKQPKAPSGKPVNYRKGKSRSSGKTEVPF